MDDPSVLRINGRLALPRAELRYAASRSGGPGGQHVNTSSTRIELWWDVSASPSLSEDQRQRLLTRLASRLDGSGRLRIVSAAHRSQLQNREAATERFREIVAEALLIPKARRATRPTRSSREARLKQKKDRGALKRERRRRDDE
ncbi:MAG: alternative ribosome rescue aminoacyl-tRNA hydrolase ArfB [Gemmatimonadales bacterium]